jgi:hypothetical protein
MTLTSCCLASSTPARIKVVVISFSQNPLLTKKQTRPAPRRHVSGCVTVPAWDSSPAV